MDSSESDVLLSVNTNSSENVYKLYRRRWVILIGFCLLSVLQSLFWILFSTIDDTTLKYYRTTNPMINFWLGIGCVAYVPMVIVNTWLLDQHNGLKKTVVFAAVLVFLAGVLRPITVWFPHSKLALAVIGVAQLANALAGPATNASPPFLSAIWFGEGERTIATAMGITSTVFGTAFGFLVCPYIVQWTNIQTLLWLCGGASVLIALPMAVAFPAKPPTPPSRSSALSEQLRTKGLRESSSIVATAKNVLKLCSNWRWALVMLMAGLQTGVVSAWQGLFDQILGPVGWSQTAIGWAGFAAVLSSGLSGTFAGVFADRLFRRRLKALILWGLVLAALAWGLFCLALPMPLLNRPLWKFGALNTIPVMILLVVIAGLGGITYPLIFEYLAEISYPVPAGTSAGVLTLLTNTFCSSLLGLTSVIGLPWWNWVSVLSILAFGVAVVLVKEEYRRSDYDAGLKYTED